MTGCQALTLQDVANSKRGGGCNMCGLGGYKKRKTKRKKNCKKKSKKKKKCSYKRCKKKKFKCCKTKRRTRRKR
jgi:hypothetical protein